MTKAPTSADQQAENLAVLADLDVIPDPLPELPATLPAFDPT
jgi:hypothetical protein